MQLNKQDEKLLQELLKKYKQGVISGLYQGTNITFTPTGCRDKIISSTGGGDTSYVPPYLKSGGASWSGTGLVYDVTTLEYYFNGDKLTAATQVTLDASDPIDNRLDAIVVDEAGVVSVIKGDASASPISPSVDESHILVQYILVEAGSTQPTIAKEDIYLENAEWTTSTYTTGTATGSIDFDNAVSPKQGVKCISANADARLGARFVRATSFDPYQYTMLSMWVRFTGSNVATNKSLNVRFENGAGALVANTINLFNFGLQRNLLNVWQLVVIPITSFGTLPTSVKGLKIIMTGGTVGQARQWDIDLISLTDNSVPSINEQAFNVLKDGALVGQSSTLNFKGAPVTVTNDPINKKIDVEVIGGSALSSITAATTSATINSGAFPIEWQWNSLSASTGLKLSSSSTANTSGSVLLDLTMTGATATQQNNTVLRIANNKTNTSLTNKGIDMDVTNGIGINMAVGANGTGINLVSGMSTGIQLNANRLSFDGSNTGTIQYTGGVLQINSSGSRTFNINTGTSNYWAFCSSVSANFLTINRIANGSYALVFNGDYLYGSYRSELTSSNVIKASSGTLTFCGNTGSAGGFGNITPTDIMSVYGTNSNVGIGTTTPVASASLEISSTTKGFLPPRMTATQASAIASPAKSLIVYVTDTNGTFTSAGIWIYTTSWKLILAE